MRNDLPKHSQYPQIVEIYQRRYKKMTTPEYRAELINFANSILNDPIENLDWKELLDWAHRGRCGEFALLYNGLLLAKGYKSRIVIDCSTLKDKSKKAAGDHVWLKSS